MIPSDRIQKKLTFGIKIVEGADLKLEARREKETLSNIDVCCLHRLVLWLLLEIHLSFSPDT